MEHYECDPQVTDHNEHTPRHSHTHEPPTFEGQQLGDEEAPSQNKANYEHSNWGHQHSSPHIETKTVCFKDPFHNEEDRKLDKLIRHLHLLSVQDPEYALLYTHITCHFPNIISMVPKPEY